MKVKKMLVKKMKKKKMIKEEEEDEDRRRKKKKKKFESKEEVRGYYVAEQGEGASLLGLVLDLVNPGGDVTTDHPRDLVEMLGHRDSAPQARCWSSRRGDGS